MTRGTVTFFLLLVLALAETFVGFSGPGVIDHPFLWLLFPLCFSVISPHFLYLGPTLSTQMIAILAITRLPEIRPSQILMILCAAAALTQISIPIFKRIPRFLSSVILEAYAVGVGFWMLLFYSALILGARPYLGHFQWLLEELFKRWPRFSMENALVVQLPAFDFFGFGFPEWVTILMVLPFAFLISVAIIFDYIMVRDLLGFEKQYPVKSSVIGNLTGAIFGFVPFSISPLRARVLLKRPVESRAGFILAVPVLIGFFVFSRWSVQFPTQIVAVFGVIATWKFWELGARFAKASQRKTDRLLSILVMFQTMAWNLGLMIPFLFALEYCLKVFRRDRAVLDKPTYRL